MSTRRTNSGGAPVPVSPIEEFHSAAAHGKSVKPDADATIDKPDVQVQFQYLKNDPLYEKVKPCQVTPNFEDDGGRTNIRLVDGPSEILNDVRGRENEFTLDNNGFCYVQAPTNFSEWSSQPQINKEYLPELETLLKREVEECDEIMFYDARIRQAGEQGARVLGLSYNPFAKQVHVDNTEKSVLEKVHSYTDMKADYWLQGRVRIINIWRPINHPVYDCPLAIADGRTLQKGDIMECDRIRADTGLYWDTMGVIKYRKGFDWYYMSQQGVSDALLFKTYDNAKDVPARWCLHTAVDLPPEVIPEDAPTRESIEVRAMILTHPKGVRRPSGTSRPHPLAKILEQENLEIISVDRCMTNRVRTDIDEAKEMKDAALLLRLMEIRQLKAQLQICASKRDKLDLTLTEALDELEAQREKFSSERRMFREKLREKDDELDTAQQQIKIQAANEKTLQAKIENLEHQIPQETSELHRQIHHPSKQLADTRSKDTKYDLHEPEKTLLLQRIERQEREIQMYKAEAMGAGSGAVSRAWQGSVDEAVRREREKDAFVIKALREEIEKLITVRADSVAGSMDGQDGSVTSSGTEIVSDES